MAKILLMEDDVEQSYELQKKLEEAGHEVTARATSSQAIEELSHDSFDVLISDIIVKVDGHSVPEGGIGLVAWVRRSQEHKELPIIAITGTHKYPGMNNILTTARQVGADIGLEKPFNIKDLLHSIDLLTGRRLKQF